MAFIPPSGSVAAWLQSDNASVITIGQGSIATVIVGGSIAASFTPPANQSVSGTVGASIIGLPPVNVTNFPTTQNVSGSVVAFQGGTQITSLVSTVPSSVQVGASIMGAVPVNVQASVGVFIIGGSVATATTNSSVMLLNGANTIGSVTALQGTNPYVMTGSVQGTMSVLGTVPVTQATASNPWIVTGSVQGSFSPSGNQSVSGTVQTDVRSSVAVVIIGGSVATATTNSSVMLLTGTNMIGSVAAYQGSIPWIIGSIYGNISGSVAATITNTNVNVSGSVVAFQGAGWSGSVAAIQTGQSGTVVTSVVGTVSVIGTVSVVGTLSVSASILGTPSVTALIANNNTGSVVGVEVNELGRLRVKQDATPIFYEAWDSGTVETTFNWQAAVLGGNATSTPSTGQELLVSGNSANSYGVLSGKNNFQPVPPGFLFVDHQIKTTYPPPTHSYAFWGVGSVVAVPTPSIYAQNAIGFELATSGAMNAVTVASQTKTVIQNLASVTGTGSQPADANTHRYALIIRGDTVYWEIDNKSVASILTGAQGPDSNLLPLVMIAGTDSTGTAGPSSVLTVNSQAVYIGDTTKSGMNITDKVHPQYAATVKQAATAVASVDGALVVGLHPSSPLPAGTNVLGSVLVLQGTNPWIQTFSNSSIISIAAGSVLALQSGTWKPSIASNYTSNTASIVSALGDLILGIRNDTMTSVMATGDGFYSPILIGPVGEVITANAPIHKWVQGTASMLGGTPVSGGSVTVIAAGGSSIFTYITGIQVANPSANNIFLTLSGATSSVIGFTIAPANGGSNIVLPNALKTSANGAFTASVSGVASIYISAQGFISKT